MGSDSVYIPTKMTGYNQGDNGAAVGPTSAQLYSGEFSEQSCMMCHIL